MTPFTLCAVEGCRVGFLHLSKYGNKCMEHLVEEVEHRIEEVRTLRAALNRAGDALAKVQPAIDPACTWALDIVPNAERDIASALSYEVPV